MCSSLRLFHNLWCTLDICPALYTGALREVGGEGASIRTGRATGKLKRLSICTGSKVETRQGCMAAKMEATAAKNGRCRDRG
jgi:hypothetical protein